MTTTTALERLAIFTRAMLAAQAEINEQAIILEDVHAALVAQAEDARADTTKVARATIARVARGLRRIAKTMGRDAYEAVSEHGPEPRPANVPTTDAQPGPAVGPAVLAWLASDDGCGAIADAVRRLNLAQHVTNQIRREQPCDSV